MPAAGARPERRQGKSSERLARGLAGAHDGAQHGKCEGRYDGKYDGKQGGKRSGKQNDGHKRNGARNGNGGGWRSALLAALARGWRQRAARAALGAGLLALWAVGYFGVAYSPLVTRARHAMLPWDRALPFAGWAVWIYLAGLAMIAAPLLLLRPGRPLRRLVLAYLVVIVVAVACFAAFPVASNQLRMTAGGAGLDPLTALALATLRALDPPFNSFPSLHVALGALAAWSMADAAPGTRVAWNVALALVAWSVCAIKQHAALDVAGALALALAVRAWVGAGAARAYQPLAGMPSGGGRRLALADQRAKSGQRPAVAAGLDWRQALGRYQSPVQRLQAALSRNAGKRERLSRGAGLKQSESRPRLLVQRLQVALSGNDGKREHLPRDAGPKRSESTPRLLVPGERPLGAAGAPRRPRVPAVANWNWGQALPRAARSHQGSRQPAPPAARASWRMLPRAALPLAVVFALFVVYYVGAA
jgi:membrane-associated phospholipid phosphatase